MVQALDPPPLFAPPQPAQLSCRVGFSNLVFALSWAYQLMKGSSSHQWMQNCKLDVYATKQEHHNTSAPPFSDICSRTQSIGTQAEKCLGSASVGECAGVMPVQPDHPAAQPPVRLLLGLFVCACPRLFVSHDVRVQQPPCGLPVAFCGSGLAIAGASQCLPRALGLRDTASASSSSMGTSKSLLWRAVSSMAPRKGSTLGPFIKSVSVSTPTYDSTNTGR